MNPNSPDSKNRISLGEWLPVIIMLFIPWLRFIGVFMLIKKVGKLLHISRWELKWVYLAAALLLFGGITEVLTSIGKLIVPLSVIALAIVALTAFMSRQNSKVEDYAACIGNAASYPIDVLMSEMGVNEKKLRRDIAQLKKKHPGFENAYIDEGHRLLVLRPEGKPVHEEKKKPQETVYENESEREYREILLEIRALNVAIDDEAVSEKIERIEEITSTIFRMVAQKPERKNEIQTFMEYYLPTTLKLLRHYARLEHQPAQGENIASSKAGIESILSTLVSGFEKQLDLLFKSDAIDITSDIKVLEKMMKMDGLSD